MKRAWLLVFSSLVIVGLAGYIQRDQIFRGMLTVVRQGGQHRFEVTTRDVQFLSGNVQLRGTLYLPEPSWLKYPGVVVCHGGTALGRRLALYVVLAQHLAARGYVVLTFDFRGIGDSEDPHRFETSADLDFVQDVAAALTVLATTPQVDSSRLYTIGHSFGAGVAVMAGIRDGRVKRVVSISPGRGTRERFFSADSLDPKYPSRRMSQDMRIDPPIPPAIFDPHLKDYIAEAILDYPVHPPIMLMDGADEAQEDLAFLKDVYENMTAPKAYVTIAEADHYFGTTRDQDGTSGDVPYDRSILADFVTAIDRWLQQK